MAGKTVRSRRLAGLLSDARRAAGLRQPEIAAYVGRTSVWVSRTEHPDTCRPSVSDVRAWLTRCGVTDPAEIDRAVKLAAEVRQPGWWHDFGLSEASASFVALEHAASAERVWENTYIPGLLQTPDYARAVIAAGPDQLEPGRVEELVRVRMERRKLLHRPAPLELRAVIGEASLRRVAGGPRVMAAQLRHVAEAAADPGVTVRVLPFAAGEHPGMVGAFTILSYPDPGDHDVLYTDGLAGPLYAEKAGSVERAHRVFARLEELSLSEGESMSLIAKAAVSL